MQKIKENVYSVLVKGLFQMTRKMMDRDQTIMSVFPYENFEEYFEENRHWMIFTFSKVDAFYTAIFRNYLMAQLQCITKDSKNNEAYFKLLDLISEIVNENFSELKTLTESMWPITARSIEDQFAEMHGKSNT